LYQERYNDIDMLPTREWARVGSFEGGKIPEFHKLDAAPEFAHQLGAFDQRIFDADLKTQNYDKGVDRFVRKFNQDEEVSAVVSVMKGAHQDHGCAVYFTQGSRRCLLLDTTYGLTGDKALWATLNSWANFSHVFYPRFREVLGLLTDTTLWATPCSRDTRPVFLPGRVLPRFREVLGLLTDTFAEP
jgi:hypothetical protein